MLICSLSHNQGHNLFFHILTDEDKDSYLPQFAVLPTCYNFTGKNLVAWMENEFLYLDQIFIYY